MLAPRAVRCYNPRMNTRGRTLASWSIGVGAVVMAMGLALARKPLAAEWYMRQLSSPELEERRHAVEQLGKLGYRKAVPLLVKVVKEEPDEAMRHRALWAVIAMGPAVVMELLQSEFDYSKGHCPLFYVLDKADLEATRDAVRVLLECSGSEDSLTRWKVGCVLWQIGPLATSLIPELTIALDAGSVHVRRLAAFVLGQIGPEAKDVIALLNQARRQEHEAVREAAAFALTHIEK